MNRIKQQKNRPFQDGFLVVIGSILPLPSGFGLLLAANTGLFIMFTLAYLSQNAGTSALPLEALESAIQRLVFVHMNFRHLFSLPSHISPA